MKIRNLILICSLAGMNLAVHGQEDVVVKGTKMITGLCNFSSQGYNGSSTRLSTLNLSTSFDRFYYDNLFLGWGFSIGYQGVTGNNSSELAIGPDLGYAFGNENSKLYPFIAAGCHINYTSYSSSNSNYTTTGAGVSVGLGLLIPVKKHLGLIIEGKYDNLQCFDLDLKQNTLSLNFGIVGLLF
jgi:hypothetical protein